MKKPEVLMIVENNYPMDIRVRKEAESLQNGGYQVNVLAIKEKAQKVKEKINDVRIARIPAFPKLRIGKYIYFLEYAYITFAGLAFFLFSHPFRRYRVIHVHNPPDTLFLVGIVGKLLGVKFIFDHHDLSPEIYLTRITNHRNLLHKLLLVLERLSCRTADVIITTNESYKLLEIERDHTDHCPIFVVRNDPDPEGFLAETDDCLISRLEKQKNLLFLGAINPQDGVDILVRVIHHLAFIKGRQDFVCHVLGDGDSLVSVRKLATEMGVDNFINFEGSVFDRKIVLSYLKAMTIGVEPAPANPLNQHSTFIKIMEYMAAEKPFVAFDLPETRNSAGDSGILIKPGDLLGFSNAIEKLLDNPDLRDELGSKGRKRIEEGLNWAAAKRSLMSAYDKILSEGSTGSFSKP